MGLDSKLCWQVFNILRADNLVVAAQYVPRSAPLERFLRAAEGAGVGANVAAEIRSAADRFNAVVGVHGPDRSAFDLMVTALSDSDDGASLNLFHRRSAFRSESMLWGLQVGAFITTLILPPPDETGHQTKTTLTFRLRQRRLRPDAPIVVHSFPAVKEALTSATVAYQPLDPLAATKYQAPLLPQFCSQPLPSLHTVQRASGWSYIELTGSAIGEQSVTDFAFGRIEKAVTSPPPLQPLARSNTLFRMPAEKMISDILVHRRTAGDVRSEAFIYARPSGPEEWEHSEELRALPIFNKSELLGAADQHAAIDGFSRYLPALQYAGDRLGIDLAEYDVYRYVLDYPILHSIVRHQVVRPK